jgi:hypothetical protein
LKIMLRASTGANIQVWREDDGTYSAQRAGPGEEPQTCWDVDLFEVIAELTGLDLERDGQAQEALVMAERAIAELGGGEHEQAQQQPGGGEHEQWQPEPPEPQRRQG